MKTQATTQKPEITSAAIYRVTDKATKEVSYAVKSDSSDTYYQVRWDQAACEWRCNCASRKPCKHERAVNEVLKIRRACIAAQIGGDTPAIVARMQAAEDRKLTAASEPVKGKLNGERGFSLYR